MIGRRAGNRASPGTDAHEYSDRELIATAPSRGASFKGESDVATRESDG